MVPIHCLFSENAETLAESYPANEKHIPVCTWHALSVSAVSAYTLTLGYLIEKFSLID